MKLGLCSKRGLQWNRNLSKEVAEEKITEAEGELKGAINNLIDSGTQKVQGKLMT